MKTRLHSAHILSRASRIKTWLWVGALLSCSPSAFALFNGTAVTRGPNNVAVVKITHSGGLCSGTLIKRRWILTANHCVNATQAANPSGIVVRVDGEARRVDKVIRHPYGFDFMGKRKTDIALFRLSRPFTRQYTYPKLSAKKRADLKHQVVQCYGYGMHGATRGLTTATLQVSDNDPKSLIRIRIRPNNTNQNTKRGDSGGPCFLYKSHQLVSVVSSGPKAVGSAAPAVSTHTVVRGIREWINSSIQYGTWVHAPGKATDVTVNERGQAWILGAMRRGETGARPYRWNQRTQVWHHENGQLERIALHPNGQPYGITTNGTIKRRSANRQWSTLPGKASDIAIGANGSVWILSHTPQAQGGHRLYRWNQSRRAWIEFDGPSSGAKHLAVDADGRPWVVTQDRRIYRLKNGAWKRLPGRATDIAIGHDHVAWVLGDSRVDETGYNVFRWATRQGQRGRWLKMPGVAGTRIAADSRDLAWVIDDAHRVFHFKK